MFQNNPDLVNRCISTLISLSANHRPNPSRVC